MAFHPSDSLGFAESSSSGLGKGTSVRSNLLPETSIRGANFLVGRTRIKLKYVKIFDRDGRKCLASFPLLRGQPPGGRVMPPYSVTGLKSRLILQKSFCEKGNVLDISSARATRIGSRVHPKKSSLPFLPTVNIYGPSNTYRTYYISIE